jgi:hypothetical protein
MSTFFKYGFGTQRAFAEILGTKWNFDHKMLYRPPRSRAGRPKRLRSRQYPRFFRRALAHHPRTTRTAWLRTASPIRVFGADLADLADLPLPAEANYLQALLHSSWSALRMTQVSASGLNCSRERTPNEEVAAACIFALIRYRRVGARE